MNGLDLAEAYFTECGLQLLNKYSSYAERIAAGMAGPGEERGVCRTRVFVYSLRGRIYPDVPVL